ncbi:monosaccharide ABC transporter membrane protein (CUT2 family) [Nocardia tenerifensis]|uniref:Monosaccharide ABC transporter membrane protein (CUT2 family) n=1 Tax=Nocardia tenerifensis TaxID=228006 RepID=A0A318KFW9_9NOCA|nr:ABC transporter permease [Nocardia tenerifensis]PXX71142.1 monosaccharide ABC transporter membrane protein (CUT2 family) [Nocardia tenerifensis]
MIDRTRSTPTARTDAKTSVAQPLSKRRTGRGELRKHATLIVALLVLLLVGAFTKGQDFLSTGNMITILTLASVIGVVTVGMTFVIIGGGIDLSVGAIIALASVWCTTTATQSYGVAGMVFSALLVGLGCGLLNGALIAYGRLVPFIVTLATMVAARGLAEQISGRQSQLVTTDLLALAQDRLLGIPLLVYLFLVVVAVGWIVLERTTFGRRSAAVGGNPEAARLAGIDVRRHTLLLYAVSGLCCGIAAIMLTAQTTTGTSTNGQLYELDAIAAVVIGGTLLSGGFGTITGSILGVLVFTVIEDLFILNNLEQPIQAIGKGAIIVAVLLFQRFGRARAVPTLT